MNTNKILKIMLVIAIHACVFAPSSHAHFLWVIIEDEEVNIYFEESPEVGDGYYLDSFNIKTWILTAEDITPQLLPTEQQRVGEKERWLSAKLTQPGPRAIESYGKYGVYRYGDSDVLLHYYARYLDVNKLKDLQRLASSEKMDLDMVPQYDDGDLELKVLWKGKPVSGGTVHIRASNGFKRNLTADAEGIVRLNIKTGAQYNFRVSYTEDESGRDNNKAYSSIRHIATLVMDLPLKE
jgi:hypothetical protein